MPTRWESFSVELTGGLISNMSRLQQGLKAPGSARFLQNFEPSTKGGYRRINGYTKFDSNAVPSYGDPRIQGSGQSGTTLVISNLHAEPQDGDTLSISGVTGTYTIDTGGVTYSSTNKEATLTLTSSLASSPADKAEVTFGEAGSKIEGVHYASNLGVALALRDGVLWKSSGTGWTKVSTPSYGTVLVDGGAQSGASLVVDGLSSDTYVPQAGDTFTVDGIEKVYTVLSEPTITSGGGTLSIYPSLASSPADNAAVTFLNSTHTGGTKARFEEFNFDGNPRVVMVDNQNFPVCICSAGTYNTLQGSTDIVGAGYVAEFKDHLFFAKDDLVTFSVPFDQTDFTPANGAGSFRLRSDVTGLIVFRTQLICFAEREIMNLSGTSVADFALTSISDDLGCSEGDTIQEVGGDVLFLGPDGVRYLGGTDAFGDFALQLASRNITDEMNDFISSGTIHTATVIREKNQYRLFRYEAGLDENAFGYVGMQKADQTGQGFEWGTLKGINVYRVSSTYVGETEYIIFANDSGYVYRMDSGNDFDGTAIVGSFYTPYMAINDPRIRKTLYKVTTYFDPEADMSGTLTFRYDFNEPTKIQPMAKDLSGGGSFSFYGSGTYGTSTYGGLPDTQITTNTTGSFFTVSLEYQFGEDGTTMAPFVLDTVLLEISIEDRK